MRWEVVRGDAGEGEAADEGTICGPGVRWGHTCNAVSGGRYLYIFGGYGRDNCQTNDVHVFDTVKKSWTKPVLKGSPPSPRDSHSCTTVGDKLFVFGGTDGKNPLKDIHILDTSSNTWIVPNIYGEGPDAREGHSSVLVNKRLFIFGGCGKSETHEEKYYNDLYILDTEKLTWERAVTFGRPPSARDCHSCSAWKNKIIVLGGEDSSDFYLADAHILNAGHGPIFCRQLIPWPPTDTLSWEPMKTSGKLFPPRAGHTTVALGSNLFVFGGFTDARNLYDDLYVLNVESHTWSKVVPENRGPSARFSVAGDCLDERQGILVFSGGCNKSLEALDDMYYLHTDIPAVNGLHDQRPGKLSVRREMKKRFRQDDLPSSDSLHPDHLQEIDQAGAEISGLKAAGKVAFEARVTNANKYGYTIETIIDGKLLHGMLFSCTSNITPDHYVHHRKRIAVDNLSDKGMDQPVCMSNAPVESRKISEQGQHNSHANESTVCSPLAGTLGSNLSNAIPCVKASWNVEQSFRTFGDVGNKDASDVSKVSIDRTDSINLSASSREQSSLWFQGIERQGS